jgi:phosphatidylserine/phosphatidylglycerophosphate/cardiolipin synthase-like enzyme
VPFAEELARPSYKWIGERRFITNQQNWRISNFPGGIGFSFYHFSDQKGLRIQFEVWREDGACETYLTDAYYCGEWGGNWQKWQTHRLPLFPYESLHGRATHMTFLYHVICGRQATPSRYRYRFATLQDFYREYVDGSDFDDPDLKGETEASPWTLPTQGTQEAANRLSGWPPAIRPLFTRGNTWSPDHPVHELHRQIDRVIGRQLVDPGKKHYLHVAMFDFDNKHVAKHLIYARDQGVDVECIAEWSQVASTNCSENIVALRRAGIPIYGVVRNAPADPREGIASMHTKFIIFDGEVVHSGSYNLHFQLWGGNWESGLAYESPDAAVLYENVYQGIKRGLFETLTAEPLAPYNLYYSFGASWTGSRWFRPQDAIITEIARAKHFVTLCMFGLSHLSGVSIDSDHETDVIDALIAARDRGVTVRIIVNGLMAHAGPEPTPWDKDSARPLKEPIQRLKDAWMEILLVYYWESIHSPLHHKFAVFDGTTVIAESYNWWEASPHSDEVLSVTRNPQLADAFLEEAEFILRSFRIRRA